MFLFIILFNFKYNKWSKDFDNRLCHKGGELQMSSLSQSLYLMPVFTTAVTYSLLLLNDAMILLIFFAPVGAAYKWQKSLFVDFSKFLENWNSIL